MSPAAPTLCCSLLALALLGSLQSCDAAPSPPANPQLRARLELALATQQCWLDEDELRVERKLMGTQFHLRIVHQRRYLEAASAAAEALEEVARLEALFSAYEAHSDVSRLLLAAPQPVLLRPATLELLGAAQQLSVLTDGAFDVTVAACSLDWRSATQPLSPSQLEECLARVGYQQLELLGSQRAARLTQTGMRLGLGAIAKGYAIDVASRRLAARGFAEHIVEAGGDLRVSGRSQGWRVGLASPLQDALLGSIVLRDGAVASSSDGFQAMESAQGRVHHLLDPKSGRSAMGLRSVTVTAPNATLADGLATAFFVMGSERALALAPTLDGVELLLLDEAGQVHRSSGFAALSAASLR